MSWDDFNGGGPGGSWIPGDPFGPYELTKLHDNFVALSGLQYSGVGTPEGEVTASVGSVYRRTDGAAGTTLYVKESGVSNTGWRALGVIPPVVFKTVTVNLTDSQIKASVTTDVDIVPAPPSGYRNRLVSVSLRWDSNAGAYTNINTTSSYLVLTSNGKEVSGRLRNLSASSITFLTDLMGTAQKKVLDWPLMDPYFLGVSGLGAVTDHDAKAIKFHAFNNSAGNFTGGNASNSARVTASYYEELL